MWNMNTSTEKIVVTEKLTELRIFELTKQELTEKINSFNPNEGEVVFTAMYNHYDDSYGSAYLQVSIKRQETDKEFQFRLADNARRLRDAKRKDREQYERLKLRLNEGN